MKIKTITLSYPYFTLNRDWSPGMPDQHQYNVDKVTDSTDYDPGQRLNKSVVDALCSSDEWKVTITMIK